MLSESFLGTALFAGLGIAGLRYGEPIWVWTAAVFQGFWFQRIYCVGHESSHEKLFPEHPRWNDLFGQLALWIILVPLPVFRKIHRFHHGSNRRDAHTSALDVFVVPPGAGGARRIWANVLWYAGIMAGGWFIHGLLSILFFLFLPVRIARKVSPAFKGWTFTDQVGSIVLFAIPVVLQIAFTHYYGGDAWIALFGAPLLVFAWVYSIQIYVYHYGTSMGPETLFHARRLVGNPLISWWLLNLNEHDTHHQKTKVVWYDLPAAGKPLPEGFAANQNVNSFGAGILQQFRGPTIVEKP